MQEAEYKEWKHAMQEITKFLKADTPFMNKRPLRYNFAFDIPPDSLPPVQPAATTVTKRNRLLRDALLTSHYLHEVSILILLYILLLFWWRVVMVFLYPWKMSNNSLICCSVTICIKMFLEAFISPRFLKCLVHFRRMRVSKKDSSMIKGYGSCYVVSTDISCFHGFDNKICIIVIWII